MGPIIELTSLFPWRILSIFAYSFAFYNIVHAALKDKFHPILTFSSVFLLRIILSEIFFRNEQWNFLGFPIFLVLSFVLIYFLTSGKLITKILSTLFYCISHIVSGLIFSVVQMLVFKGEDYVELFGINYPYEDFLYIHLVSVVSYCSISFLFSGILKLFAIKKSEQKHKKLYAYFSFLPLSHISTILIVLFMTPGGNDSDADFGPAVNSAIFILLGAILIFDCSFPFLIDHFEKLETRYEANKKELTKSTLNYQQLSLLKEEKENLRKIKHDYLNLTTTAKGFIEIGKADKAVELLSNTEEDLMSVNGASFCMNETLNTLMYIKHKEAAAKDIDLHTEINESSGLFIDDYSICRVIHNILDNAIEAAQETKEKYIELKIVIDPESFTLYCKNTYIRRGKTYSRRPDRGYGTGIIKDIVKKYEGTYTQHNDNDYFYSDLTMKNSKKIGSSRKVVE